MKTWPLAPSPPLTAAIDARIDGLTAHEFSFVGHCKAQRMLPLHSTLIYTWALQPDGVVQWIDHEAFGYPCEPETNRRKIWAVLAQGVAQYPELDELLPVRPDGVEQCTACAGVGSTHDTDLCFTCDGLGWRTSPFG